MASYKFACDKHVVDISYFSILYYSLLITHTKFCEANFYNIFFVSPNKVDKFDE